MCTDQQAFLAAEYEKLRQRSHPVWLQLEQLWEQFKAEREAEDRRAALLARLEDLHRPRRYLDVFSVARARR